MDNQIQMYKVFVNNRPLRIGRFPEKNMKNLAFQNSADFEVAIHLLSSHTPEVNIYAEKPEKVWSEFQAYFTQIFAAGGLVFNQKKESLWIYRLEKWDLPKGKMEAGETPEQTAIREVEEECGIMGLEIIQALPTTYHLYFHNTYILKVTYWFEMIYNGSEILHPQHEEGISEVRWMSENDYPIILQQTYANIVDLLQETIPSKFFDKID
ncbi:MAG: NUDIX domain-containing protein [Flavobacteriaceae bacterium]|nr:NUDIX domain-containing protein [Flavobacteriaceae bacterium]